MHIKIQQAEFPGVMENNGGLRPFVKTEIKQDPVLYSSPEVIAPESCYNDYQTVDIPVDCNPHTEPVSMDPNLANIDPAVLVFNAHMLPSVMAPLPDDADYHRPQLYHTQSEEVMT